MNTKTPILCINDAIIYDSLMHAAQTYGVSKSAISLHLSGRRSSVGGLVFVKVTGTESASELEDIIATTIKNFFPLQVDLTVSLPERGDVNGK